MYSDILSSNNQKAFKEIKSFLKKIKYIIKALEGSKAYINLTLPNFKFILKIFKSIKILNVNNLVITTIVNSNQSKFNKYYKLSNELYTYVIVVVLNLCCNQKQLEKKQLEKKQLDIQGKQLKDTKKRVQKV